MVTTDQRVALVTGAGSGIGRAVAQQLAAAGFDLALVGRRADKLCETAALIAKPIEQTVCLSTNIAAESGCDWAVKETIDALGGIDALVNVAGYAALLPIEAVTEEAWRTTIDTNLSSIIHLTAKAWPQLKQRGGIIVNVSSMASIDPFPNFAIYAAAKAAVNMFTRCTATEGAAHHIRAVAIAPGAVETPMLRGLFDEKMIPRSAALSADDVAKVIVDCITGKRAFTPGETVALPSP